MNKTHNLICTHSALAYLALTLTGIFAIAGWIPPVPPSTTGDQLVAVFADHRTTLRIGLTIFALASMFWWSFSAAVSIQMKRIEGAYPILANIQLAAASGICLITLFAAYFWLTVSYRPETPASILQVFSDYAWLTWVGAYPPGLMQSLAIALCILTDKNEVKIYPRWVGYANVIISFLYVFGGAAPFFHSGPFAWNGLITFWLLAATYFPYIALMWWATVQAINKAPEAHDEARQQATSKPRRAGQLDTMPAE